MSEFKVGEIAIGQNFIRSPQYNGMECEILLPLQIHETYHVHTDERTKALRYKVEFANGVILHQSPNYLRKKKPPEEKIDWVEKLNLKSPERVKA